MRNFENIPARLLLPSYTREDVSILIGENGGGKSQLLNDISQFYLSQEMDVIAIANSIYDKFTSRHKNFKSLRASSGKTLASKTIFETLRNIAGDDLKRIRNIANTLEYVGYDPVISFRIKGLNPYFDNEIKQSDLNRDQKEKFLSFLNRFVDQDSYNKELISINFYTEKFDDIKNSFLIQIFSHEKQLKSFKLIKGIEVFLSKKGELVPLKGASSGELSLITTLLYITSTITETTVILVDEPENSLHPKWQIDYIKKIDELFYLYEPKVVVATHSPLIINGAEINTQKVKIFKGLDGNFIFEEREKINIEEIYQGYFDVTTPENRFLSENIIDKINLLSLKKIGLDEFNEEIQEIQDNSYDERQKKMLDEVLEIGTKINNDLQ